MRTLTRNMYGLKGIGLLLACLCFMACQEPEPDRSYLDGVPCAAPCWQGITPGITDETTAMTILFDPNLINQETLDCQSNHAMPLQSFCAFWRVSNEGGGVGIKNGFVSLVRLNSEITLDEAIAALGPPDFIDAKHGSQLLNEGKCYNAHAYYLKGIRLWIGGCEPIEFPLEIVSGNSLVIFPDMGVGRLDFFQPGDSLQATVVNAFGHGDIERYLINVRTWAGYGPYPLPPGE